WGEGATIETPKCTALADALATDGTPIAITQWQGPGEPEIWVPTHADPAAIDPSWIHVGWDVCDGFFPSRLCNCGYLQSERAPLAGVAERLNEHGLLADLPSAFASRDLTNRRVAEHAPFAVLGLYLVRCPRSTTSPPAASHASADTPRASLLPAASPPSRCPT